MQRLSVTIITKNEAHDIRACLESVKWADEIILLDSGSSDATVAIAQEYTAKVKVTDWPGYGVKKNRALQEATGDWVLSLDADECVSAALETEIKALLAAADSPATASDCAAYAIPRVSTYCGKIVRFGDWRKDYCKRLFRRGQAQFQDAPVHESLLVQGKLGKLKAPLLHNTFKDLEEMLEKLNQFSSLSARMRQQQGRRASLLTAIGHGFWTFLRGYVFKLGFLDGREGFVLAVSNAEGSYYRYLKLLYATKNV
jgi:glycosyltransferase involved in cell wall biosynthesis